MAEAFDFRSKIDATWPNESKLSMALAAPFFAFLHFDFIEMLRRSAKTESEFSSQLSLLLHLVICDFNALPRTFSNREDAS